MPIYMQEGFIDPKADPPGALNFTSKLLNFTKGLFNFLIGLLVLGFVMLLIMIMIPAPQALSFFKMLGLNPDAIADSQIPMCDGSVMPNPGGDSTLVPAVQSGPGGNNLLPAVQLPAVQKLFLLINNFKSQGGMKPMMCKKNQGDTHPDDWCRDIICMPQVVVGLCGNGVRDLPNEFCDGNDMTGCYSGQICTSSCTCAWQYDAPTEPPIKVQACMFAVCGDLKCQQGCEDAISCVADCGVTVTPTIGPSPTPGGSSADGQCSGHGGVKYQTDICACPGVGDHVVVCGDGTQFDNPNGQSCTPTETCQPPDTNPQPTDEPAPTCTCVLTDPCADSPTGAAASCPRYVDSCTGATCRP
jgi:hypothetical protein